MTLSQFQCAMGRLVVDAAFAEDMAAPGAGALADYVLTDRETRRLLAIARDRKLVVAQRIHRFFRINALLQSLPLTVRLLGDQQLRAVSERFWKTGTPENYNYQREARRFGSFIVEQVRSGQLRDPYLVEILRFELAVLELAFAGGVGSPNPLEAAPAAGSAVWKPRLRSDLRVVVFEHSPAALLGALEGGRTPPALVAGRHYLLLERSAGTSIRLAPLLPELGEILESCRGGDVAEEICALHGIEAGELRKLVDAGFLDPDPAERIHASSAEPTE